MCLARKSFAINIESESQESADEEYDEECPKSMARRVRQRVWRRVCRRSSGQLRMKLVPNMMINERFSLLALCLSGTLRESSREQSASERKETAQFAGDF